MKPLAPARLDVLFGRHGVGWRLYVRGWAPPYLRTKLDPHGEAFPVSAPDLEALREYMWKLDAPYVARPGADGGVALEAAGRSAVVLWEFLDDVLAAEMGR